MDNGNYQRMLESSIKELKEEIQGLRKEVHDLSNEVAAIKVKASWFGVTGFGLMLLIFAFFEFAVK